MKESRILKDSCGEDAASRGELAIGKEEDDEDEDDEDEDEEEVDFGS